MPLILLLVVSTKALACAPAPGHRLPPPPPTALCARVLPQLPRSQAVCVGTAGARQNRLFLPRLNPLSQIVLLNLMLGIDDTAAVQL